MKILKTTFCCLFIVILAIQAATAQERIEVNGKVISESEGLPLLGVNVVVEGTTNGAVTDFDGEFTITMDPEGTLVFSYMGFSTKKVPVSGRQSITVELSEN